MQPIAFTTDSCWRHISHLLTYLLTYLMRDYARVINFCIIIIIIINHSHDWLTALRQWSWLIDVH